MQAKKLLFEDTVCYNIGKSSVSEVNKMVSSRDVARLANVSQSTVSRAYRDDVYIDPITRQRVMDAAKQLGYYPNLSARSLRNQRSRILGLVLSDPDNTFFASVIRQLEQHAGERGYRLVLTYTDEDPDKERFCLETLISSRAEGVLVMPVSRANEDMYRILQKSGIAAVQLFRSLYDDVSSVCVNDEQGAYQAAKYLLDQGHRRIIITEYTFNQENPAKTKGYRRACEEYGVDPEEGILSLPFENNLDGIIAGALASTGATAIISANIPITLATLKACKSSGLTIPDDISIVAYDDSQWLEFQGITAITHPMQQIGDEIAQSLFREIDAYGDGTTPERENRLIKPYLLLRNSVKKIQ